MTALTLDRALDRLLHSRAYLDAFLQGRREALGLDPDDLAALDAIDREQLERTARKVREDLLRRSHRGCGSLPTLFPATVAAWRAREPGDDALVSLADALLEHPVFERYREVSFTCGGLSLEETFYHFAEAIELGDAVTREAEFLAAMGRALVTSPDPEFDVPERFRRVARGYVAVATRSDPPVLHAAVEGRYVTGALTPFLAELVTCATTPESARAIAARHGVPEPVLVASLRQLGAMGLVGE